MRASLATCATVDMDLVHVELLGCCPVRKRAKSVPALILTENADGPDHVGSGVRPQSVPLLGINLGRSTAGVFKNATVFQRSTKKAEAERVKQLRQSTVEFFILCVLAET